MLIWIGTAYGLTAVYENFTSLDELKAAIDESYGNWAVRGAEHSSLKLWRVESEKFAIQLRVADRKDEKSGIAEAGTKMVIYIAFGGKSACSNLGNL